MKKIKLSSIKITDSLWQEKLHLVSREVLDYQWQALSNNAPGAPKSYSVENFQKAAAAIKNRTAHSKTYPTDMWMHMPDNTPEESFKGWVFQDSDLYKWVEAVSYAIINGTASTDLREKAAYAVELIASAAEDDGYIDTLYSINNINNRFENLRDYHELYCFGHLTQAACAYYQATGDKILLNAAAKYADFLCCVFGDGEGQKRGYPGHQVAEEALLQLYEETGEEKYLELSRFFIDERGQKPYYFDLEKGRETDGHDYIYNQAHIPVRQQHHAVGHAVRGVYLYTAMADLAKRTGDESLREACRSIWQDIAETKLYITGGIGSTTDGEAFCMPYYLPNELAYAESCASVGLVFFADKMMDFEPLDEYGDVAERCIYNNILGAMAEDGKSFFYANPLYSNPLHSEKVNALRNSPNTRKKWFNCACCPPNVARLIESLGSYCLYEDGDSALINLLLSFTAKSAHGEITVENNDGKVKISLKPHHAFTLLVRIPSWSEDFSANKEFTKRSGFAEFSIKGETEICIDLDMRVKLIRCSPALNENAGKAAVMRGPFVYCLEGVDNGEELSALVLDEAKPIVFKDGRIFATGYRETLPCLYSPQKPKRQETELTFIPFYSRLNRGETEMSVFVRTT